jgi:hypothetical protein
MAKKKNGKKKKKKRHRFFCVEKMTWNGQLSNGAIAQLFVNGQELDGPVLQVIHLREIVGGPTEAQDASKRYRYVCVFFFFFFLARKKERSSN